MLNREFEPSGKTAPSSNLERRSGRQPLLIDSVFLGTHEAGAVVLSY